MQVETTEYKKSYTCNGTGPYPITFTITTDDDGNATNVEAVILDADGVQGDPLTLDSGDIDTTGLNVYTNDSYDNTNTIVIYRKMPFTVSYDIDEGGSIGAEALEDEIGTIYMHMQELDEKNDRAMQIGLSDDDLDMTLPNAAERAGKYLAFNAESLPIAADGTPDVPCTAALATVLDDETIADALTTMGFSSFFQTLIESATAEALRTLLSVYSTTEIDAKLEFNSLHQASATQDDVFEALKDFIPEVDDEIQISGGVGCDNNVSANVTYVLSSAKRTGTSEITVYGIKQGAGLTSALWSEACTEDDTTRMGEGAVDSHTSIAWLGTA
jgi:hypothetical protein